MGHVSAAVAVALALALALARARAHAHAHAHASPPAPVQPFDWAHGAGGDYLAPRATYLNPPGCRASWAFAAASMVSSRMAIRSRGVSPKVSISPQVLLNCATPMWEDGCEVGQVVWALEHIKSQGIVDNTCMGYRGKQQWCIPRHVCVSCYPFCTPVKEYIIYKIESYTSLDVSDQRSLRNEIEENGPIACTFRRNISVDGGPQDPGFSAVVTGFSNETHFNVDPSWGEIRFSNDTSVPIAMGIYSLQISERSVIGCWAGKPGSRSIGSLSSGANNSDSDRHGSEESPIESPSPSRIAEKGKCNCAVEKSKEDLIEMVFSPRPNLRCIEDAPRHFDWRENLSANMSLTPVRNHHVGPHYCGACYAMASTSTFSDRLKIAMGATAAPDVLVSAQMVVDCVRTSHSHGCFGGNANDVFQHIYEKGILSETCRPFISKPQQCEFGRPGHNSSGTCNTCQAGSRECKSVENSENFVRYYAKEHGVVSGEEAMMAEIGQRGPIECMMATPKVFENYVGGIMCDTTNATKISHDVELVGWGEERNGTKYWIGRNSWGTDWGEGGFFRVCRGINNMAIESACAWVVPDLDKSIQQHSIGQKLS